MVIEAVAVSVYGKSVCGLLGLQLSCSPVCHHACSPHINFVSGTNGSGKSAVLQACQLALGVRASSTDRAKTLGSFIKSGATEAVIGITLWNTVSMSSACMSSSRWPLYSHASFPTPHNNVLVHQLVVRLGVLLLLAMGLEVEHPLSLCLPEVTLASGPAVAANSTRMSAARLIDE